MSLFSLKVSLKEKNISPHPWERRIKDVYASKIKYAHNSVNNSHYPQKKPKVPNKDRVKFTIIGNRVTKEFIYCVTLVKGLHKWRWKIFDAPVIRGVTSVEWPSIWYDLKLKYGGITFCLESQVAVLLNDKILGGEKELKELIETKYLYHLCLDYCKESKGHFANYIKSSNRPCVYLHIKIDDKHVGTMIFMLYADSVPYTCENFLRLCKEKKGGYSGTPVHRIVKDCWIQCGGFGLKSSDLDCENFIVPHDKRGVLCMANDGRHRDCSTQFFVLLQPAPWMEHKYVAFGQLIDGESTLKTIENVSTWYESPKSEIIIYETGILNLDCHDIMINKGTKEYIFGHIEDLFILGKILYEELLERVFLAIEFNKVAKIEESGEGADATVDEPSHTKKNVHETKRFMRKKEEIEKQIANSQVDNRRPSSAVSRTLNNEFDVEVYEYEYEPEEYSYQHVSLGVTTSFIEPEVPFYIELTDVPYPGEVDSTYNLIKFLKGDYCLESDLYSGTPKKLTPRRKSSFPSEMFHVGEISETESESESLDSDDEREIRRYLKLNVDRVSFAGGIIRSIARGFANLNILSGIRKSELITDEELRRFRLASVDRRARDNIEKKVSIAVPTTEKEEHRKIKRRQTGFVRPEDLEKIHIFNKSSSVQLEEDSTTASRKVRIAPSAIDTVTYAPQPVRRPTGIARPSQIQDSDIDVHRQSVLTRLYDDVMIDDEPADGPKLKDYKPMSETQQKHLMLLTFSPEAHIRNGENTKEKFLRHSIVAENESLEQIMKIQHGKKFTRKISLDYIKTMDQAEQKQENSIRSLEFAKTRPSMTVLEYQQKNQKYHEKEKGLTAVTPVKIEKAPSLQGLRLPGDTPLYSLSDVIKY